MSSCYPHCPPRPPRAPCRHCQRNQAQARRRGLCQSCYVDRSIRALYPRRNPLHGIDSARPAGVPRPLPRTPTDALPGTEEKVAVLADRAARGLALWHPLDAVGEPRDEPADLTPFGSLRGRDLPELSRPVGRHAEEA